MRSTRIVVVSDRILRAWSREFDEDERLALCPWCPDVPLARPLQLLELYFAWAQAVGWRLVTWCWAELEVGNWIVTLEGESQTDPNLGGYDHG